MHCETMQFQPILSHCVGICLEELTKQTKSVALVRDRSIPTELQQLVGEVSAKFCGQRGVPWST
jgi:hypothetical protein